MKGKKNNSGSTLWPTLRANLRAIFVLAAALPGLVSIDSQARDLRDSEPQDTGTTITIDDDLFAGPGRDRDYTGGFALTWSGARAADSWLSLDPLLAHLDRAALAPVQAERLRSSTQHALSLGVIAFTPHDVLSSAPVYDDRPYASLVFVSSARRYVSEGGSVVYNTNVTLGMLGLDAVGEGHRALHRITGSDPLRGYSHQVSAGGEPTLRYGVARQALLARFSDRADLKWTVGASAGTVTEGSVAVSGRWGRLRSPWWSFAPEQNTYMQDAQPLTAPDEAETFFVAGVRAKARVYNAFLQGQFRHSDVRYSGSELNTGLAEGWAGVVTRRPSGLQIRYIAHYGSPEVKHGPNARSILWGSVELVRPFDGAR